MQIDRNLAVKVLQVVDAGLVSGIGQPEPGKMCVEAAVCYSLGLPHGDNPTCVAPSLRKLKIALNDCNWSSVWSRAKGMRKLAVLQLGTAHVLDGKEFLRRTVDMTIRKIVPRALLSAASIKASADHKEKLKAGASKCAEEGTRESALEARDAATAAYAADAATAAAYAATAAAYAADAATAAAGAAAYAATAAATYAADAATAAAYAATAATYAAAAYAAENARDEVLGFFADEVAQILIDMNVPAIEWLDLLEPAP